jgi:hypothetical protein
MKLLILLTVFVVNLFGSFYSSYINLICRLKPRSFLETLRMTGSRLILKATISGIKVAPSGSWLEIAHLYHNVPPRSARRMATQTHYMNHLSKYRNFFAGEGTGSRSYVDLIPLHVNLQI